MLRLVRLFLVVIISSLWLAIYIFWTAYSDLRLYNRQHLFNQQHSECLPTVTLRLPTQQPHEKDRVVVVNSVGNFTERIIAFNAFLASLRKNNLTRLNAVPWQIPKRPLNFTLKAKYDYLPQLSHCREITTIVLPWLKTSALFNKNASIMLEDHSDMLLQTYYDFSADNELCFRMSRGARRKNETYKINCSITATAQPLPVPYFFHTEKLTSDNNRPNERDLCPTYSYTVTSPFVFFMHVIQNAILTFHGTIFINNFQLALRGCHPEAYKSFPLDFENYPLYDEVFVVRQRWGRGTFHRLVEILPRLSLFVKFLKDNPEIPIMTTEKSKRLEELLNIIGLQKSPIVKGAVRAKTVYMPRATPCGTPNVQESQMLFRIFRDYIKQTFSHQPRNKVILIRRSKGRGFSQHNEIEEVTKRAAMNYNLTYTLFPDNPVPSLNETMMMFHSAVVIIAPHGAGLSNMYFSQPGTFIIEGVCNPPIYCYLRQARVLGHRWHGIMGRGTCFSRFLSIPVFNISAALNESLRIWSSHVNR